MGQPPRTTQLGEVAACTLAAAHRRDHEHDSTSVECLPHVVEVVHLGSRAVMVCHDCHTDSGFLDRHQAEVLADEHRALTDPVSTPSPTPKVRSLSLAFVAAGRLDGLETLGGLAD